MTLLFELYFLLCMCHCLIVVWISIKFIHKNDNDHVKRILLSVYLLMLSRSEWDLLLLSLSLSFWSHLLLRELLYYLFVEDDNNDIRLIIPNMLLNRRFLFGALLNFIYNNQKTIIVQTTTTTTTITTINKSIEAIKFRRYHCWIVRCRRFFLTFSNQWDQKNSHVSPFRTADNSNNFVQVRK